ncbi:MAG TPA: methyltransferase domain-containing protein [Candidatus Rubrimentiphilum sp.]|nr:methyltransferase domain-containing protein [Candidatus Rubrimentiphilum sp.]
MLRAAGRELLDDRVESIGELEENFRDIERANRFLGGLTAVRAALRSLEPETILDVGCGSADIGRALVRDARRRGRRLHVTCLDANPDVLEIARRHSHDDGTMSFVRGDGSVLPFEGASFDVVLCNLTLHHCDPDVASALLRELRRVARLAPVVTDLRRSRIAWAGTSVLAALFTRNRLTRHDAPLSVLRAYTPLEAVQLARDAGWRNPRVRLAPFYRMVLTDV